MAVRPGFAASLAVFLGAVLVVGPTDATAQAGPVPLIPEPMVFDMIRPLGARRGELEANTLAQVTLNGPSRAVEWAPEVEYAIADGFAVEVELPFTNGRLTDYKIGLQGTFGTFRGGRSIHGVQYLGLHNRSDGGRGDGGRSDGGWSSSLLYLLGNRFGERLSTMTMIGAGDVTLKGTAGTGLLVNHTTFWDVDPATVIGFEINRRTGARRHWLLMPQLHRAFAGRLSVQAGLGAERGDDGPFRPRLGIRVVREF